MHLVDDAPDFLFGAFNQAAHRAGGVDHEDQLDHRLAAGDVFDLCRRIVLGPERPPALLETAPPMRRL